MLRDGGFVSFLPPLFCRPAAVPRSRSKKHTPNSVWARALFIRRLLRALHRRLPCVLLLSRQPLHYLGFMLRFRSLPQAKVDARQSHMSLRDIWRSRDHLINELRRFGELAFGFVRQR